MTGKLRRQLTPSGLSWPLSLSARFSGRPPATPTRLVTPTSDAAVPAGAFQTPREASVLAMTPAMVPQGGTVISSPFCDGSAIWTPGKYTAAFAAGVPVSGGAFIPATALATVVQPAGGSTSRIARWSTHSVAALVSSCAGAPGRQSRLKMPALYSW
jgi:hypothetical protein